jgi:methylphosphotriester-DNA--protein-cysteine methyltransferase
MSKGEASFVTVNYTALTAMTLIIVLPFRLLKDPRTKIYEICDRIGYADQDHFRESFKKQFGLKPTEYRNTFL